MASRQRVAGAIRSWLMLEICSLRVLESCMKHCLYLFLCKAMRQCYGGRKRDLELGLYGWTTSEDGYGSECTDKGIVRSEEVFK